MIAKFRALGVAIKSYDAWTLADHVALSKVLDGPVQRQPDPERTADPKAAFRCLFQNSQRVGSISEHYAEIGAVADLSELTNCCPRGFAPLAERVKSL